MFRGGAAFTGGKGCVGGTLIGVRILTVLSNGMTLLNIRPCCQQLTKGAVLLSVYMDAVRTQADASRKIKGARARAAPASRIQDIGGTGS